MQHFFSWHAAPNEQAVQALVLNTGLVPVQSEYVKQLHIHATLLDKHSV